MVTYSKKIQIDVQSIVKLGNANLTVVAKTSVMKPETNEIIADFLVYINRRNNGQWKLHSYDPKNHRKIYSVLFPKNLSETAWEDGIVMSWISENIKSLLYIGGYNQWIVD